MISIIGVFLCLICRVSATSIGTLEVCNTDQLNAFKGHAVITYGPISSWQPEIFTEVGVVIGNKKKS